MTEQVEIEPRSVLASLADIQRLERKIDQLTDRLDTLLMERGRTAGGNPSKILEAVLAQTAAHPAMNDASKAMLRDFLKPVINGMDSEIKS
jgi:hypothetical protein